jgi:hypothetical protein
MSLLLTTTNKLVRCNETLYEWHAIRGFSTSFPYEVWGDNLIKGTGA